MLALLCVVTVAMPEQALAGGGKTKKNVRVDVMNENPGAGRTISVWVVPEGTALPTTVGQARNILPRREVAALKSESFPLKEGNYIAVAVDTIIYANAPDATPVDDTVLGIFGPFPVNNNVKLKVKTTGGGPIFKPTISQ
ncbi:MAG: hypothetical protein Q8M16_03505 [Pirellulaceae bacterium]|nr:hypothetical protein [Pirellulaceae bacterium]